MIFKEKWASSWNREKKNNNNGEVINEEVRRRLLGALGTGLFTIVTGKIGLLIRGKDEEDQGQYKIPIARKNGEGGDYEKSTDNVSSKNEEIDETIKKINNLKEVLNHVDASEKVRKNSLLFLVQSEMLKKNSEFFPPEIFSDSFFWAVIKKESGFGQDIFNERSGASGVMQVLPIAIQDTLRVLNKFGRKNKNYFLNGFDEDLNEKEIANILEVVKKDWSLGEAIGRLYFLALFKNYHIGEKYFLENKYEESRRELLVVYNAGLKYGRMSDNELKEKLDKRKYKEVTDYYRKILRWIDEIDNNNWNLIMAMNDFKNNKS